MKPEFIGEGSKCPKCRQIMSRFQHKAHWQPKKKQPYYFKYWDKCAPCKHLQHYEAAKVKCE